MTSSNGDNVDLFLKWWWLVLFLFVFGGSFTCWLFDTYAGPKLFPRKYAPNEVVVCIQSDCD